MLSLPNLSLSCLLNISDRFGIGEVLDDLIIPIFPTSPAILLLIQPDMYFWVAYFIHLRVVDQTLIEAGVI